MSQPKNYLLDQIELARRKEEDFWRQTKCFIMPGGATLLQQERRCFYFTPVRTQLHINRDLPFARGSSSSLRTALLGEGRLLLSKEGRRLEGFFGEFGLADNCVVSGQVPHITRRVQTLGFNDYTRMPKSAEAEKTLFEGSKDKQELFKEQQQLSKFISSVASTINTHKQFLDCFGNWVAADFSGANCFPSVSTRSDPLLFITDNKTLFVNGQTSRAYLIDYSAFTYTIFEEVSVVQLNEERATSLIQVLKHISSCAHVTMHLLEGCTFTGRLEKWHPMEGKLTLMEKEIEINGVAESADELYQTVLRFPSGDSFEGGLLNGKFTDFGKFYQGNRLILEGIFVENLMIRGTLHYYADEKVSYTGEVFYDSEQNHYKKHGSGVLHFRNGDIYEGQFELDKYAGRGKILYAAGVKGSFEGQFVMGLKHGHGVYFDAIKRTEYIGEYANNKRSGYGTETVLGEFTYRGQFKEGKKHGAGFIEYQRGGGKIKTYEGGFEDDKKHGEGVETDVTGSSQFIVKYWKDGQLSSSLLFKKNLPSTSHRSAAAVKDAGGNSADQEFYSFI